MPGDSISHGITLGLPLNAGSKIHARYKLVGFMGGLKSMKFSIKYLTVLIGLVMVLACSTPQSEFGVYRQSDGTVGVHAPKSSNDSEVHEVATIECKKLGKHTATLLETRKTVNDRFPTTYIFMCSY